MFRAHLLLPCAALGCCTPGGEVALRGRALASGGSGCLEQTGGAGAADADTTDVQPEPTRDPNLTGESHRFFKISLLDSADRSPIAGATITTDNDVVYTTDKNGVVAYYEPGLMGQTVFFFPARAGYEFPKDGFGYRGKRLDVTEGGSGELLLERVAGSVVPAVQVGDLDTRLLAGSVPAPDACFGIRVVDQATKRGVPLVTLTSDSASFVTDSQGFAAVCNPDWIGTRVSFGVTSHGYELAAGSVELEVAAGEQRVVEIARQNLAERLYRSTGQGIYRDSVLLGLTTPVRDGLLNGRVTTQDTVQTAEFGGKLFWCWGTTTNPSYPLANFGAACARSELPSQGGLDPRLGVDTDYIREPDGVPSQLASSIEPTSAPTWLSGMVTLPDAQGNQQLFEVFTKPNGDLSVNRRGLLRFDVAQQKFVDTGVEYPLTDFVTPAGQPVRVQHADQSYVYYGSAVRVPASAEALLDVRRYEPLNALLADTHLIDVGSGTPFSITDGPGQTFSRRRGRFLRLVEQVSGTSSYLGEIWYVEGDTPMGPWVYARKVVSHNDYSFTAPWFHPYFEQAGGRFVFFEGTYTASFAGNDIVNTPRYNHNQLLYRLDLDQPELALPVPVYDASRGKRQELLVKQRLPAETSPLAVAFFAADRAGVGTVPVYWSGAACAPRRLLAGGTPLTPPVFFAVSPSENARAGNLVPLFAFSNAEGEHAYSVSAQSKLSGLTREDSPLAYVWPSPLSAEVPVGDYAPELTADAGADQCLSESAAQSGADVRLDASGSHSESSGALRFEWRSFGDECVLGTAPELTLHVASGAHAFVVRVSDAAGHSSEDDVVIQVGSAN